MKIRADLVQMYRDVHSWVGIVAGLFLFVAFYAGAITMFEEPLKQWSSPPVALPPPVSLEKTPELLQKAFAAHPEAQEDYTVAVTSEDAQRGRLRWESTDRASGKGGHRNSGGTNYAAGLDAQGQLVVVPVATSAVAWFVDMLHQQVGIPLPIGPGRVLMGCVALLYAVALVSGVIAYLPALVKMLFAVRMGQSLRKRWLDFHNLLGLFSLPFHIVMALSSVVFAFHGEIFALEHTLFSTTQQVGQHGGGRGGRAQHAQHAQPQASATGVPVLQPMLAPTDIMARVAQQAPEFVPEVLNYMRLGNNRDVVRVFGHDERYPTRGPTGGFVVLNAHTGQIQNGDYFPGHQQTKFSIVTAFFALHFGSFGGNTVRWVYAVLGLAGAFLFYTGNQLWIVTRRRRERESGCVQETRGTRFLAALTIGCSLGCVAGISALFCAVPLLPYGVQQPAAYWLYYSVFCAFVVVAFCVPGVRGKRLLLAVAGGVSACIPLVLCMAGGTLLFSPVGGSVALCGSLLGLFLLVCAARYRRQL